MVLCLPAGNAGAVARLAQICDSVAVTASQRYNVPLDVLRAITRSETGRPGPDGLAPWPWTVNMEGVGKWFDTRDEARAYVFQHYKRGARSFDVGCFQINFKWHGQAFASIDEMFEPQPNADYAARFLGELYQELGSWEAAAGAYHSRTPKFANRYTDRFQRIRSGLSGDVIPAAETAPSRILRRRGPPPPWPQVAIEADRVRPILGTGGTALLGNPDDTAETAELARGSLFPLGGGAGSSFISVD